MPTPIFAVRLDAALRVKPFISKEETRYYLNGVYIEAAPEGGVFCVATDGHRLGIRRSADGICKTPTIFKLPPEVKMPGKLLRSPWLVGVSTSETKGHISIVDAAPKSDEDTAEFAMERVEDCLLRIGQAFIDGTYPDWKRIIPTVSDKAVTRAFNGTYVGAFGKYVTITGDGEANPHVVRVHDDPDFVGILMPMRLDGRGEIPAWLRPAPKPLPEAKKKAA